jgi:site-specific DNA-methyltransferase (adenine-specific)
MPNISLYLGDAVKWAQEYSGEPFHAILCDAPYHLTSITKRVGAGKSEVGDTRGAGGPFKSVNRGFMGKQWDGGDLAFNPETWEAFGNVLHSGAFGMAFASSRGWHRMAVAIEDAGFIIHPTIFGFCYGSGFPKATRVKLPNLDWCECEDCDE